ncbi:MAG: PadR family transcriptional regulator [Acholeplasma sp.]|nr:PadR family transcriptional regulator [Acholeplasma sp.]
MKVEGDFLRGYTDAIILSVLDEADNYGYQINSHITTITDEKLRLTEATLYTSFKRLESDGFIVSYWQDGTNTKRKYYSITTEGKKYLAIYKKIWGENKKIIDKFLGGYENEK